MIINVTDAEATFGDYEGPKRYVVSSPGRKAVLVAAPDDNAALVAAANYWGARWQDYDFYTSCMVVRQKTGGKK